MSGAFAGLPAAVPFATGGAKGTIRGWRLPRCGDGDRVVLYLHGNGGNIATLHRVQLYKFLSALPLQCDVYALDYGCFGASDGWFPDEASAVNDVLATIRMLRDIHSEVIIWAHSLGTGIAISALRTLLNQSSQELPFGLILEAPFLSVPDVPAHNYCRWLPESAGEATRRFLHRTLACHRMPSADNVCEVAKYVHLAVLHGVNDDTVPYAQGKKLAEMAGAPLHTLQRNHNDIIEDPSLLEVVETTFKSWEATGRRCGH